MAIMVAAALGAAAAFVAAAALLALMRAMRLQSAGRLVQGRVVAHETQSEGSAVGLVVQFVVDGRAYTATGPNLVEPRDAPIGSPRAVRYLPADPSKASIAGFGQLFGRTVALLIVAVLLTGLAIAAGFLLNGV